MDKRTFKSNVLYLLKQEVIGLTNEEKIKYMKKWIRDYQLQQQGSSEVIMNENPLKVGQLVRTTMRKIISSNSLSDELVLLLQDSRYCKMMFDINYPFLKKVMIGANQSQQRKINGYDRYWEEEISVNGERYFICNDWYERNRSKFIRWVDHLTS